MRIERKKDVLSEPQRILFEAVDSCVREGFTGTLTIEVIGGKAVQAVTTAEDSTPRSFAVRTI